MMIKREKFMLLFLYLIVFVWVVFSFNKKIIYDFNFVHLNRITSSTLSIKYFNKSNNFLFNFFFSNENYDFTRIK